MPAAASPTRRIAVLSAGNGFGARLAQRLRRDPAAERVLRLEAEPPPGGVEDGPDLLGIDIAAPGAEQRLTERFVAERIDTVVHAAFFPGPTHRLERLHELESVGTMHLLAACAAAGVSHLVAWSHTFLYGARPDNPALLGEDRPLRAPADNPFARDKLDAEAQLAAYAARHADAAVAVLRTAPLVGPGAEGVVPALLRRRVVPVAAGYAPLIQVLHEYDALDAFHRVICGRRRGVYNVVAAGVLPVTTALLVAGRVPLPLPAPALRRLFDGLWTLRAAETTGSFVDFLRFPCVADGGRAARELGFRASFTTHEALVDHMARAGGVPRRPVGLADGPARAAELEDVP